MNEAEGDRRTNRQKCEQLLGASLPGAVPGVCVEGCGLLGCMDGWMDHHNAASLQSSLRFWPLFYISYRINVFFLAMSVSDDEQVRRGRKLAFCRRARAGGWASILRTDPMLCPDAALPSNTTGNGDDLIREKGGVSMWWLVWWGETWREGGREGGRE